MVFSCKRKSSIAIIERRAIVAVGGTESGCRVVFPVGNERGKRGRSSLAERREKRA